MVPEPASGASPTVPRLCCRRELSTFRGPTTSWGLDLETWCFRCFTSSWSSFHVLRRFGGSSPTRGRLESRPFLSRGSLLLFACPPPAAEGAACSPPPTNADSATLAARSWSAALRLDSYGSGPGSGPVAASAAARPEALPPPPPDTSTTAGPW